MKCRRGKMLSCHFAFAQTFANIAKANGGKDPLVIPAAMHVTMVLLQRLHSVQVVGMLMHIPSPRGAVCATRDTPPK